MVATLKEAFGDLYKNDPYSVPCSWLISDDFYFDKSTKKCIQLINKTQIDDKILHKMLNCPDSTYVNIPKDENIIGCKTGNTKVPCEEDYTFDSTKNICIKK